MYIHPTLDVFRQQNLSLSREAFLARYRDPFLVLEMKTYKEDPRDFRTLAATSAERPTSIESRSEAALLTPFVALVTKSDRNIFNNMITIGRATNNDICVQHASISKFHAFFKKDPATGSMAIWDAGSRFGSALNAAPVKPGSGIPVQSGDTLVLARSVSTTFYSPDDFFEYLKLPRKTGPQPPR